MKLENNSKRIFIELVCLLYILLFVYASVSKLMDFENFKATNDLVNWLIKQVPGKK